MLFCKSTWAPFRREDRGRSLPRSDILAKDKEVTVSKCEKKSFAEQRNTVCAMVLEWDRVCQVQEAV